MGSIYVLPAYAGFVRKPYEPEDTADLPVSPGPEFRAPQPAGYVPRHSDSHDPEPAADFQPPQQARQAEFYRLGLQSHRTRRALRRAIVEPVPVADEGPARF